MRAAILFGVLLCFIASGAIADQKRVCTKRDAMALEDATGNLPSWNAIYAVYKKYQHCDDVSADESFSDAEEKLLTKHWEQTGTLQRLIAKDPGFEKFVLRHIDTTWSLASDQVWADNVQKRCLANMQALCRKMWDSLENDKNASMDEGPHAGHMLPPALPNFGDLQAVPGVSPFGEIAFGKKQIQFGLDYMEGLLEAIKAGDLAKKDQSVKEYSLCYFVREHDRPVRIWLTSIPAVEDLHVVTGFYVAYENEAKKGLHQCPELPAEMQPVRLDTKVWLGATAAHLKESFGKPVAVWNDLWVYRTSGTTPAGAQDASVVTTLVARVRNGKVVALYALYARPH
jgi:hypothetical protein